MGYGNVQGTFNIGIVETDVQAIVNGITGYYGRTLTDVDNDIGGLGSYLYDGNSAVSYLSWINSNLGSLQSYLGGYNYGVLYDGTSAVQYLNWISNNTGSLSYYLYDGNSAAQYLNWICSNTGGIESYLSGSWYGVLYDGTSAVQYLNWINSNTGGLQGYLAGWNGGPLTNIDSNTSYTAGNTSYLYNIDSAISSVRDYLYDWNSYQSVAAILNDIRNCLQQLSFDGNGRLLVSTN